MSETTGGQEVALSPQEPQVPDFVRQRIRSAAQAFGSWLAALVVAGVVRLIGVESLPEELGQWLTYVIVPAVSAVLIVCYIVAVQLISRRWPRAEGILFGRSGDPVYIDVPLTK